MHGTQHAGIVVQLLRWRTFHTIVAHMMTTVRTKSGRKATFSRVETSDDNHVSQPAANRPVKAPELHTQNPKPVRASAPRDALLAAPMDLSADNLLERTIVFEVIPLIRLYLAIISQFRDGGPAALLVAQTRMLVYNTTAGA